MRCDERGMALGMVVAMSLVFAVAAFGVMTLAVSRGQTSSLQAHRLKAQYAAEGALVLAMQRLWQDPEYPASSCVTGPCPACTTPGTTDLTDTVTVAGTSVAVTVTDCGAGFTHKLSAKVTYTYN